MATKQQIFRELTTSGYFEVLDYPINIAKEDISFTNGCEITIGRYPEQTAQDVLPIVLHEYYHCRLKHFKRCNSQPTGVMKYLTNIAMDIEINEYLKSRRITSKFFEETGQFKNSNSLGLTIPSQIKTFEDILSYILKKLPPQKLEALKCLDELDISKLPGSDLMQPEPRDINNPLSSAGFDDSDESKESTDWEQETIEVTGIGEDENGIPADLTEVANSYAKQGVKREVALPKANGAYDISWEQLLRKFTGRLKGTKLARTFQRPRRTDLGGSLILPAFRNVTGTIAALDIYIDVSGSMNSSDIRRFIETQRSLRQLSAETRITYYFFNTELVKVPYSKLTTTPTGGGTTYDQVYESIMQRNNPAIMFTDMCASEGDLSSLEAVAKSLLVLTFNSGYKDTDLPYVIYIGK